MMRTASRYLILIAGSVLLAAQVVAAEPNKQGATPNAAKAAQPQLEPRAVDIMKAMTKRLSDAEGIAFTAVVAEESRSRLGPALQYTTRSDVVLRKPNKLKIITPADGPAHELYYDGKTITAFSPVENFVAIADAPPTITDALKFAYETAAIYFPFTDLIVDNPYQVITEDMQLAYYIGQSKVVGDTTTDMIAYANHDVFVQAWIGVDDKLPRKMRAVFADDPLRLRHEVTFSDWKLDGAAGGESFASDKAAGAKRIPFARPDQKAQTTPSAATGDKP